MFNLAGKEARDFIGNAVMPDSSIKENFNLKEYLGGQKGVLLFYPLNFTFVCPSELIACNNRLGAFAEKKTKIIGVSIDSVFSHLSWKKIHPAKGGIGDIRFPLVGDIKGEIINSYGVMHTDGVASRGTVIIDSNFIIRHVSINDLPIGRNIDEMLRILDAIDHHEHHGEVCPAGWKGGQEGMPATQEGVSDYLTSHSDKL